MADPTAATHLAEFKGFGELQELQVKVPCGLGWVRREVVDVKMVTSTGWLTRPLSSQALPHTASLSLHLVGYWLAPKTPSSSKL